ncbi:EH domain-containing protein 1 isoform X2 [Pipistrellus kuhlii]|uniref:EH domain-containing protein 1 isoform X2 n=1 Tax=Pipistrellus kuhlii TaxID=59472 RepID=UPI001E2703E7|nr:EH domain-containing protein 1 isoform X2 [Pipistrellus kuhlii]
MFSWVSKDARRKKEPELFQTVAEGLRQLYSQKLLPLEEHYRFHEFHSPALEDADFDNKPMVLLVGQYSTGKTTFIRHLIEQDFPGMRIGPEPTTDSFIAVMHGPTEGVVPGNALVVDPRRPFRKLNAFGNAFLNRVRLRGRPGVVRRARRPHHPAFRRPQAGHLGRVLRGHQGPQEPRGQDPRGAEQGRPDRDAAADAGVRGPHVVPGQDHQHARGGPGLHRLLLVPPPPHPRQPQALRGRGAGPVQRHPVPAPQRRPPEAQRPHQAGEAGQGARLHHQLPQEGDAQHVRQREQEEGAGEQPGRDLRQDRAGASDLRRRLPEPPQDAGTPADPRLHQVPGLEAQAAGHSGRHAGQRHRPADGDGAPGGVPDALPGRQGRGLRRHHERALRARLRRGGRGRHRRHRVGGGQGQAHLRRDLLHAVARQRQDHGRQRQEGDGEVQAAQHGAGQDLEAGRRGQGRAAGRRGVRPGQPPHQGQAGGPRAAHRPAPAPDPAL